MFDRVAFERTVETVRAKVSALLWQLVVVQVGCMRHALPVLMSICATGCLCMFCVAPGPQEPLCNARGRWCLTRRDIELPIQAPLQFHQPPRSLEISPALLLLCAQSDLPSHLASIKAYFLLANGELYHTFLTEAARCVRVTGASPPPHQDPAMLVPASQYPCAIHSPASSTRPGTTCLAGSWPRHPAQLWPVQTSRCRLPTRRCARPRCTMTCCLASACTGRTRRATRRCERGASAWVGLREGGYISGQLFCSQRRHGAHKWQQWCARLSCARGHMPGTVSMMVCLRWVLRNAVLGVQQPGTSHTQGCCPAQSIARPPPCCTQAPPLPPCAQLPRHADVPAFDPNWDGLWLQYDAPWPLGLLFSPQVMARWVARRTPHGATAGLVEPAMQPRGRDFICGQWRHKSQVRWNQPLPTPPEILPLPTPSPGRPAATTRCSSCCCA